MPLFKKKTGETPSPNTAKTDSPKASEMQILNQPMTLSRLASLYGVSRPTMRKWIKPLLNKLGKIVGQLYNLRQVRLIINHLGVPGLGSDIG